VANALTHFAQFSRLESTLPTVAPQEEVETNAHKREFACHTVSSMLEVCTRAGCQSDSKREFQSGVSWENSQVMGKEKHSRKTSNTKGQAFIVMTLLL
jgi:hypothetical protein